MAQTNYTPISLYYSTTVSAAPTAGNLVNGELAINITDGKLYYKDNTGTVKVIAGTGGTGVVAGSNTQIQFNNNGVFGASANLTWDGSFLTVASIKDSALTSGRVTYAGASGLLTDSANLTFDGTNLTLGGGTANGVAYLNGSKVLTTGSALTFDGTNFATTGRVTANDFVASGSAYYTTVGGTAYGSLIATAGTLTLNANNGTGLIFSVASSEGMRLTSTGLGIGTSSPSTKLQVNFSSATAYSSGATGNGLTIYNTSTTNGQYAGIYFQGEPTSGNAGQATIYGTTTGSGAMDLVFSTRGSSVLAERARITSAGLVGVGISNPGQRLSVLGTANASYNAASAINVDYQSSSTGVTVPIGFSWSSSIGGQASYWGMGLIPVSFGSGTADLGLYTQAAERVRVTAGGNVGIGLNSVTGKLDVLVSGTAFTVPTQSNIGGASSARQNILGVEPGFMLNTDINGSAVQTGTGTASMGLQIGYYATNDIRSQVFWSGTPLTFTYASTPTGAPTERMRITSAGNVCIGSTEPGNAGVLNLSVGNPGTTVGGLQLWSTTSGSHYVQFGDSSSGGAPYSGAVGYNHSVDALTFWTNQSEKMRLTSAGYLGIGVTSPAANLDLRGSGVVSQYIISTSASSQENQLVSLCNSGAGYSSLNIDGSNIKFRISGSNKVGIDSTGLGVGTMSPATALQVNAAAPTIRIEETTTGGSKRLEMGVTSAGVAFIGANQSAQDLTFQTVGSERARITSTGIFFVGVTSQQGGGSHCIQAGTGVNSLQMQNNGATPYGPYINFSAAAPNNASQYFIQCTDTAATRMLLYANGGLANYQANNANLSDLREKTNFAPAKSYLDIICAIPVQTFNYIDQNLEEDDGLTLGVVAQDVQAVAPELVMESNWGTKDEPKMRLSIYQTDLQYALMKALQELKAEFDAYKASHP